MAKSEKKVLTNCGTVMSCDMRQDERFAIIRVDIAGPEIRRILEAFFESLPPSQKDSIKKEYSKIATAISNRYGKFEVDIQPVFNKEVLEESGDLVL
ncbi:MAG: hypothetical protein PWQ57_871 [Desulfovibrionales bacterium]|jgi:hypothetical protein|nr:hypothetical protein [Desulfovibrionales bacterium]